MMRIDADIFCGKLFNSCKVKRDHSFAFWKLEALVKEGEAYYIPDHDCCYAVYKNLLFSCFSNDNMCHIPVDVLNGYDCISLNAEMFDRVKNDLIGFEPNYGYKLHYDYSYTPQAFESGKYQVVDFDFNNSNHYTEASLMINQGQGDWMKPDNISKITREPCFDPSLWIFAKDASRGRLTGIAISTYNSRLRETDIEWFYMLPECHGRGAGRFLLEESIRRSKHRSEDIRVGGTNEFYKKCGFIEKEQSVWAPKKGYSLIAPCIQPNILP